MSDVMEIMAPDLSLLIDISKANLKYLPTINNVIGYGTKGDGVTNDKTALQNAINATPSGGILFFPPGQYYLTRTGTESELLLITKPIRILAYGATLLIGSAVPNTVDVIRVSPTVGVAPDLAGIEGLTIKSVSGSPARHAIHLDVTNPGQYLSRYTIQHNNLQALGGSGIYLTNPTNVDGFFTSYIRNNLVYNGMYFNRIGDSVHIEQNTITGNNVGIQMTAVSGAMQVTIKENNITCAGGALKIDSGSQVKIHDNQFEQTQAYTGITDAMIYIGDPVLAEIIGNNMNTHGNVAYNIHLNGAYRTSIDKNFMFAGTTGHIEIDAVCNHIQIGYNNMYTNASGGAEIAPIVTDNGIGTMGVLKTLTLQNGWTNADAVNYNVASVIKYPTGEVHLSGIINPGTLTGGTTLFTLPVGYRPSKAIRLNVTVYNGGAAVAILVVNAVGVVGIETIPAGTTRLDLDSASFTASY